MLVSRRVGIARFVQFPIAVLGSPLASSVFRCDAPLCKENEAVHLTQSSEKNFRIPLL